MDDATWRADQAFGASLSSATLRGYRLWAAPLARKMAKSPLLTRIVARVALPWAHEMAFRVGVRERGSLLGRFIMLGIPVCTILGHMSARRAPSANTGG